MGILHLALITQLAAPARASLPLISLPTPGLDDSAAYVGYQTRLFKDIAGNTVQIYIDSRSGRAVHLWADADDESIAFTARNPQGQPVALHWATRGADVASTGRRRTLSYRLTAEAPQVDLGWFLLGSMRVERDFQYSGTHTEQYGSKRFAVAEVDRMIDAIDRLPPSARRAHLGLLNASSTRQLRARLQPVITRAAVRGGSTVATIRQVAVDARDTLALQLVADVGEDLSSNAGIISIRSRSAKGVALTVRISSSARPLTPLTREEIFRPDFLAFLASVDTSTTRGKRLEREARGVELLSSREKLMAGLPAYATYFGRDMLMTALMMRDIWRDEMSQFAIASVLRKLGPNGDVSHEEALGGQAIRESASDYARAVQGYLDAIDRKNPREADSLLASAGDMLRNLRRVRENYHMIDDEFQFPVLVARWLSDTTVTAERKRAFLMDSSDGGGTRLVRLFRELALVARMTAPYAADPVASNLVSFARRDDGTWSSASWRDSGDGYAGGRFAMDVNALWAPTALEATASILRSVASLGISLNSARARGELTALSPLGRYTRDTTRLRRAIETWRGAVGHFVVSLDSAEVHARMTARLAALPDAERAYWTALVARTKADADSLSFLALSLDSLGHPIAVANTDPSTGLFLGVPQTQADILRDVRLFAREYPVGLLIDRVGPVVANDAYGPPFIWPRFERDRYHGPRVVWGREVNLFLLGTANRIAASTDEQFKAQLRAALSRVQQAVEASGFHSELWSYELRDGAMVPVRYGTGSDVQLWSTTDLAVQFALSRLH